MIYRIGVDLGGTKMEGAILDENHEIIFRKRTATEREKGYEHILNNIVDLYQEMCVVISNNLHTFGIGIPGAVSPKTGLIKNANTTCLIGQPFVKDLEKRINQAVAIENDANCFAMTEALLGAGKGKQMVFGVIMGTGCGGGIVHNGKVWQGLQSIAGEWGHMVINPNGPHCYCGKRGCVETYISGYGVTNRFFDAFHVNKCFEEIIDDYRKGDDKAEKIIENFFEHFGLSLSNLINILDPDVIVLGGGVSNFDELYTIGVKYVRKYIFSDDFITPIVKNQLGDSAGVIGAALIGEE